MNIRTDAPFAIKAMMELEQFINQTSIPRSLKELIKIRASQINGCAYCIDLHSKDAFKYGEKLQRIVVLSAWREAKYLFTEEEQVVLSITEEITLIHQNGLSELTLRRANQFFNDKQIAEIVMAVITINCWNRIAISSHLIME
ncbi:carboxymuconolactone decarboxylase family protein [Flavihumibacter cheonanensis]|jgi:AhpD family alkylhydroperoxidase|uniref:carboxymuconolactone decarboxylase family protein n=1 Tax=Flavihumibacter cheonanensis TaxID=1442385 RepID=UPI001EF801B9|nr:carboxymuconolactone decarboxylase family protein [Flavihumibacter cheonanensis]MCG7754123.1 carboxymuconolactone decarboxylase family protein [Flavihumibacter cheonanensis]